jgi:adenylosuccinate synthase
MHLDTLSGLKEIRIAKAYKINGNKTTFFPANTAKLALAAPIYETVPGWDEDITKIKDFHDLPLGAQHFICLIEEMTGKPITIIGVGPKRNQTIFR